MGHAPRFFEVLSTSDEEKLSGRCQISGENNGPLIDAYAGSTCPLPPAAVEYTGAAPAVDNPTGYYADPRYGAAHDEPPDPACSWARVFYYSPGTRTLDGTWGTIRRTLPAPAVTTTAPELPAP